MTDLQSSVYNMQRFYAGRARKKRIFMRDGQMPGLKCWGRRQFQMNQSAKGSAQTFQMNQLTKGSAQTESDHKIIGMQKNTGEEGRIRAFRLGCRKPRELKTRELLEAHN
jgi:hypothetical protein